MGLLNLVGRLSLDGAPFHAALKGVKGSVAGLSQSLNSTLGGRVAALVSVGAIAAATKNLIQYGSEINDTSQRIGVGTDELQRFVFAAKQNGAGIEEITSAFRNLAKARQEAMQDPKGEQAQAFTAVGIDAAALKAGNLAQMFRQVGKAIQDVNFGAGEQPLVEKLMGRSAGALIPMFVDGLDDAAKAADEVGAVLEASVITRLDDVGDKIDEIIAATRKPMAEGFSTIADGFLSAFKTVQEVTTGVGAGIGAWWEAWKDGGMQAEDQLKVFMDGWVENQRDLDADALDAKDKIAVKRQEKVTKRANRVKKPFEFGGAASGIGTAWTQDNAMSPTKDSLTSIGNFLGADTGSKQLKELSEITRQLKAIEKNTGKTGNSGFPL